MKDIIFHGKRKDNGSWIEGSVVIRGKQCFIFTGETKVSDYMINWIWYEVEPETVCQYTGLKDKNGKNDIVKINDDVKEAFKISDGVVVYRGGSFIVGDGNMLSSLFTIADFNYVLRGEVIGNIFDNLQLLKGDGSN